MWGRGPNLVRAPVARRPCHALFTHACIVMYVDQAHVTVHAPAQARACPSPAWRREAACRARARERLSQKMLWMRVTSSASLLIKPPLLRESAAAATMRHSSAAVASRGEGKRWGAGKWGAHADRHARARRRRLLATFTEAVRKNVL